MDEKELMEMAKNVEKTFQTLNTLVEDLKKVQFIVDELSFASKSISEQIENSLNSQKISDLKLENKNFARELSETVTKIDENIETVLQKRSQILENTDYYSKRFKGFVEKLKNDERIVEETLKKIPAILLTIEAQQKKVNGAVERVNRIADGLEILSKADKLIAKLDETNNLLRNQKSSPNQNLNVLKENTSTKNFVENKK